MSADLATRRPVWLALSTMFLNADVALTRDARVQVLAASGLAVSALEHILIHEVYPACWAKLSDPAGEAQGFDPAWLEARIFARGTLTANWDALEELAQIAVPHSDEWQATKAALETRR
ncbi:MAG: hypothetical protein IPJ08_02780 [Burkholderiales bacterium]|nr:hypothetical protein [Burkholderiales bacterium]